MEGNRFGRLIIVKLHSKDRNYNKRWECICDCGKTTVVLADKLKNGNTKSCGCLATEVRTALVKKADEERRDYTRNSWTAMLGRCHNPKYPSYPRYGEKGITVCDRWRFGEAGSTGWECFFADMGPKPTGHSIDRIDNSKGYYLENCRWADKFQQAANRKKRTATS